MAAARRQTGTAAKILKLIPRLGCWPRLTQIMFVAGVAFPCPYPRNVRLSAPGASTQRWWTIPAPAAAGAPAAAVRARSRISALLKKPGCNRRRGGYQPRKLLFLVSHGFGLLSRRFVGSGGLNRRLFLDVIMSVAVDRSGMGGKNLRLLFLRVLDCRPHPRRRRC